MKRFILTSDKCLVYLCKCWCLENPRLFGIRDNSDFGTFSRTLEAEVGHICQNYKQEARWGRLEERERGELMVGVKRIKECLREILP